MKVDLEPGEVNGILQLLARVDIKGSEAQAVVIIQAKLKNALMNAGQRDKPEKNAAK